MDLTANNYNESDFKQATAALLPPGEYWQYENGSDLDKLLSALGQEFKTVHDETALSVLYGEDNNQTGWRLVDYQSILNLFSVHGVVFDKPSKPNFIYISCDTNENTGALMQRLESHRLPHTQFHLETKDTMTLSCVAASAGVQVERSQSVLGCAPEGAVVDLFCAGTRHGIVVNRRKKALCNARRLPTIYCAAVKHSININRRLIRAV